MHVQGVDGAEESNDGSFVDLRRSQAGAFTRTQAMRCGISDKVLGRGVRARQLQRIHPGVYVDFTGPLPWETRVWCALLACGPGTALTGPTALRKYGVDGDWRDDRIHLAVPHTRRLDRKSSVVVSRHRDLPAILHRTRRPLTVRIEVALLLTAGAHRDVSRRAAVLLDACRQRRTTPHRILAELPALPSLAGRSTLRRILADASDGVQSFLEHAYLRRVERAHGLPHARRQVRATTEQGVVYRDTEYEPYGVIVELDGQAGHADSISRWRDMTRDNAAATSGKVTLRFGYQLVSDPCSAAIQVAAALQHRGWPGRPRRCSPACRL
ncbi:type IV toxin-antitoxin system AbiEi family antitoxin domain-containing protein [Kribbella sp. NPDC004875]|uniref:type IV toxin-antitoxin system AbiEi family antitoxin domain-containing protein n=1 Tax=Kribbella sp. NPDC004875 TaxID=3364107 RepID=UPI003677306B